MGADILRLWVSSVEYQSDVRISDDILRQVSESYRKIRNTFRFMLGNLADFDPAKHRVHVEDLQEIDKYMYHKLQVFLEKVKNAYEQFDYARSEERRVGKECR